MVFSLPMLIPIFLGVVGGVLCHRLYETTRQRIANRRAIALLQLSEEPMEDYLDSLGQHTRIGETAYPYNNDEPIRA